MPVISGEGWNRCSFTGLSMEAFEILGLFDQIIEGRYRGQHHACVGEGRPRPAKTSVPYRQQRSVERWVLRLRTWVFKKLGLQESLNT